MNTPTGMARTAESRKPAVTRHTLTFTSRQRFSSPRNPRAASQTLPGDRTKTGLIHDRLLSHHHPRSSKAKPRTKSTLPAQDGISPRTASHLIAGAGTRCEAPPGSEADFGGVV